MKTNISIIIPTYNKASYLSETVDSCLAQLSQSDEILVVDDGSNDNTPSVMSQYADNPNIRYIYQKNGGPSAARNTGIRNACGAYICFLDSDDTVLENSFEVRKNFLDDNRELDLIFTEYLLKSAPDKEICNLETIGFLDTYKRFILSNTANRYIFTTQGIIEQYLSHPCIHTNTIMVRRELLKKNGCFNENLHCGEDTEMWLRLLLNSDKIGYLDIPTAVYNFFRMGISTDSEKAFQNHIQFWNSLIGKAYISDDFIYKKIAAKYLDIAKYRIWKGKVDFGRSALFYSLSFDRLNLPAYLYIIKSYIKQWTDYFRQR